MRGRLALAAQDEHKWLAPGVFCLLAGWIILNSGWSTQNVGLPLMALGLILPLVPFIAQQRAIYEAERAQNAIAKSDTERNKMFRRGQVYELHSAGYSSPS